jgi:hypothetical protein
MPLEGHWRRTNTPLRRLQKRERSIAIAAVAVTAIALLALVLATASDTRPPPAPGCIRVLVAGRTGGEVVHACGAQAKKTCAQSANFHDPRAEKVAESCREAGIEPRRSPAQAGGQG